MEGKGGEGEGGGRRDEGQPGSHITFTITQSGIRMLMNLYTEVI
jgi:hypothetical protein